MPACHEDYLWWMGGRDCVAPLFWVPRSACPLQTHITTWAAWMAVGRHGNLRKNILHASEEWIVWCNCLRLWVFPFWLFPLHFQIVAKRYRDFEFPSEMTGIWRYLNNAYAQDEFTNTCLADQQIEHAYSDVAKRLKWSRTVFCLLSQLCELDYGKNVSFAFPPPVTILGKIMPIR